MGYKDNVVEYGFGQLGCAIRSSAGQLRPPKGKVIIAIQFLADNALTELTAENSPESFYIDGFHRYHAGTAHDVVAEATSTVSAGSPITMTTNYATVGYAVGWEVYSSSAGVSGAKVTEVNVGGQNQEIKLDTSVNIVNGEMFYFMDPNEEYRGTGGERLADGGNVNFPKGLTIYGRWSSVTTAADTDGGIICYFGN